MWKLPPFKAKVRAGLTLIELLVAISLSVILISTLYYVFNTSYKSYKSNSAKAEINQNARIALERISRDLRQTSSIVTTLPPDDTDPLNPPPSNLEFVDGHNTTQLQYINYFLVNGSLHRQVIHYYFSSDINNWVAYNAKDQYNNPPLSSVDEDTVKADKVTALQFFGTNIINIVITTGESGQSQTYQTQVLGRNI